MQGQTVSLSNFGDPHLAAVLLKKFLRDLPQPIFLESTYEVIRRCPDPRDEQEELNAISYIRGTLLPELAPCTLIVLSNVLCKSHPKFIVVQALFTSNYSTASRSISPVGCQPHGRA